MTRLPENSLIRPSDVMPSQPGLEVIGTFNPGAVRVGDEVLLLVRVAERPAERDPRRVYAPYWDSHSGDLACHEFDREDSDLLIEDERVFRYRGRCFLTSISHLRVARSRDGRHFEIDPEPSLFPACAGEAFGIEDARITSMGDTFLITYKAVSEDGVTTALARTADFKSFERIGTIFCPENLDVVIFPEKFDGQYAAWTRPVGVHCGAASIWMARSNDLIHWGQHRPVMRPRGGYWDSARVGAGCVPFRVEGGWLALYHGADRENRYCAGTALLDSNDPGRILGRSESPILKPEARYEREGFFGGVVFPCGHVLRDDGRLSIYYGAADETVCAVETSIEGLVNPLPIREDG